MATPRKTTPPKRETERERLERELKGIERRVAVLEGRTRALAAKPPPPKPKGKLYDDPALAARDERYRKLWGIEDPGTRAKMIARDLAAELEGKGRGRR